MGERTRARLRWAGITVALACAAAVWVVPIVLTTSSDDCPIAPGASGGSHWVFDGNRYEPHAFVAEDIDVPDAARSLLVGGE
jgi:hypothetical protein